MGFILSQELAGYPFEYWRIGDVAAVRVADKMFVRCTLDLFKDKPTADLAVPFISREEFEFETTRDSWTQKTGTQQLGWLYKEIQKVSDKFAAAIDDLT